MVIFILLPFLFSRRAKSPGGAAGTALGTGHGTVILVTSSAPKEEWRQSQSGIVRRI